MLTKKNLSATISRLLTVAGRFLPTNVGKAMWRRSLDGYSGRFIPGRSLVRIRPPLPKHGSLVKRPKTSPFHGGNTSSNLVGVTIGELAQLGEHLPYKQGVTGSSPVLPTTSGDFAKVAKEKSCNKTQLFFLFLSRLRRLFVSQYRKSK